MEYNSSRKPLPIREYGRYVQALVENCMKEPDRARRTQFAKEIIELMALLNPQLRSMEDFRPKLWDHLYQLSDFKLDVDAPYPMKGREEVGRKPERMKYPQSRIRHRHYGKYAEKLIQKAVTTEDQEKRAGFTESIGNFMKLVYQNWSKEHVNDETIKSDLRLMSDGQLSLTEDQDISNLTRGFKFTQHNPKQGQGGNNKKKFYKGGGGGKKFYKKKNKPQQ